MNLVILSGGMDSAVILAGLRKKYPRGRIEAVTFNYGAHNNREEISRAKKLCVVYKVRNHHVIDLAFVGKLFQSSMLKGQVPAAHDSVAAVRSTVVPNRNAIMLSIAVGLASSRGLKRVYIGIHAGRSTVYADCRPIFVRAIRSAVRYATNSEVDVAAPFLNWTKRRIAVAGKKIGVDFRDTYTCLRGEKKHCGVCVSCEERKEALEGFDPTEYSA